jgi:hypothetical protein
METKIFKVEEMGAWNDFVIRHPYYVAGQLYEWSFWSSHFGADSILLEL